MIDPTMHNGRKSFAFEKGSVIKSMKYGTREIPFHFSVINGAGFSATVSVLPGHEFMQPEMVIRVPRLDIHFVGGDTLKIHGGFWTVRNVTYDYDKFRAYESGDGRVAYKLYLSGGKPNG